MKNVLLTFTLVMLLGLSLGANAGQVPRPSRNAPPPEGTIIHRDLAYVPNGHARQKLDLYLPPNAQNPALILIVHGGAFAFGDKSRDDVTKFLQAGYAVASVNYRLSGDALFPAQIEDCKAAVRYLRVQASRHGYDPHRIGAYGESAGGTLVALLGTTGDTKTFDVGENLSVSSRVQAVVDFFGPTDFLQMDANRAPNGDTHNQANSPESRLVGGPIQENKEKVAEVNPVTYVTPNDPPFFLAHGTLDRQVPYHQSVLLEAALKKAGVPVTLYTLEGIGHAFRNATADKMALDFFAKHLTQAKAK